MINYTNIEDFTKNNKNYYSIKGKVIHGKKIGRLINFPTANISYSENISIPLPGVYAVKVIQNNKSYFGMMNVGKKPTLDDENISMEVHIFDFQSEIYGEEMEITFLKRIRNQEKFNTVEDLKKQLLKDKYNVLLFLNTI